MKRFQRNIGLIGESGQDKLSSSNILVVGVGGVGGYAAEMLARAGVGRITLVDRDTVDVTNINRQIIALESTVGLNKVDVMKARMLEINPRIKVTALKIRYDCDTAEMILLSEYDYCIDAIDSVKDKVNLIAECKKRNLDCISALGAGNRLDASFEVKDIFSTSGDGLARAVRTSLRKIGIESHKCVCAATPAETNTIPPSSISYVPAMMGCIMAREVIKDLLCR